jgi:MFS family permease
MDMKADDVIQMMRPATIVYVFAIMMTSLCTEYYQFMLSSVLMGSAVAFLQFPTFAVVSQYFDKKRGAALGLVVSGSSVGGVVFPLVLSKLLNGSNIGFGWAIRITGFLMVPFMLFACATISPRLGPRKSTIFIGAAWKDKKYVMLVVAMLFMMMGMWTPIFYIPTYAVSRGMRTELAANLLAIINASSTFGRILPGIGSDHGVLHQFADDQRFDHRLLCVLWIHLRLDHLFGVCGHLAVHERPEEHRYVYGYGHELGLCCGSHRASDQWRAD